ncbi:MAG: hypothetical protein FJW40_21430 [Acidobacteria bacterium]|nr:hypothetical protein [Acidobacteriota bacterium]
MLTRVHEQVGRRLGEEWLAKAAPAFLFWAGGGLAWIMGHGWSAAYCAWQELPEGAGLMGGLAAVLLVRVSGLFAGRLNPGVLRLLEGYYHPETLRRWLMGKGFESARDEWTRLAESGERGALSRRQEMRYVELDERLRRIPVREDDRLPTRLGNILRASEGKSREKYGLDVAVCWPRLWMALPKEPREDLAEARTKLDESVQAWLWSVLFPVWAVWWWWAAPLGLGSAVIAYACAVEAAKNYGDLLESAFDVHRRKLYEAVRWKQPESAGEERAAGAALTAYLLRGSDAAGVRFADGK